MQTSLFPASVQPLLEDFLFLVLLSSFLWFKKGYVLFLDESFNPVEEEEDVAEE